MASWEQTISNFLHEFRLDSIKSKILVFALSATLVPALSMALLSYVQNKQFLEGKITQELRNVTSHSARELDLWLKERYYDLRIFSSSYEVTENLAKILGSHKESGSAPEALQRRTEYLKSVRGKFADYEELMVVDLNAQVKATSADTIRAVKIPSSWLKKAKVDKVVIGDPYWDEVLKKPVMMIVEPIRDPDGRFLGLFGAKLNFHTIRDILMNFSLGQTGRVHLITQDGTLISSSRSVSVPFMKTKLKAKTTKALFEKEADSLTYSDYLGKEVVGALKRVPVMGWAVVAEIGRQEAFAQIVHLRNLTLLMVSALLMSMGLTAYLLGLTIIRPLHRLADGAANVAAGNLDVDLPVVSRGELGYVTMIFNYMVETLRKGRKELALINNKLREKNKELAKLSITDGLTGLHNRKHLMETLSKEVTQAQRYKRAFSVLMIDIDHFKKYNDTYGHPAGDYVLTKIASILLECIRSVDSAARYGGEEFMVMLPETDLEGAVEGAERIRSWVEGETFGTDAKKVNITVSIGAAEFSANGDTVESIISSADTALYKAKRLGRNQVVRARRKQANRKKKAVAGA